MDGYIRHSEEESELETEVVSLYTELSAYTRREGCYYWTGDKVEFVLSLD